MGSGQPERLLCVLTIDSYLTFCDEALDAYAGIVRQLGDPLVNATVPGVEGSNSAFAVVSHVVGVMGRWARTVNRGIVVPRDRDAEFTATGTVDEALALLEVGRARLHEDVLAADPASGAVTQLTDRSADLRATGRLRMPRELTATAPDGYPVHGWVVTPDAARHGDGPYPAILMIHGGPYAQYTHALFDEVQVGDSVVVYWS